MGCQQWIASDLQNSNSWWFGGLVVFQNLRVFFSLSRGSSIFDLTRTHTSSNIHEFSSIYLGLFENVENAGYPQPQDSNDSNGQHMLLSEKSPKPNGLSSCSLLSSDHLWVSPMIQTHLNHSIISPSYPHEIRTISPCFLVQCPINPNPKSPI